MNRLISIALAALPIAATAFSPQVRLSVEPRDVVITESAEATVSIFTQRRFLNAPSMRADFIPQGERLAMSCEQSSLNGTNAWLYTVKIPLKAEKAGAMAIGPVSISVPISTGFFGFVTKTADYRSGIVRLNVVSPPEEGRPNSYCGALSRDFGVSATLDANVCTAGDPLLFTLEITGATDFSMVYPPESLEAAFRGTPFRIDLASRKTDTDDNSKSFVWRVRALKAGTVEFPSIAVSFFDIASRSYRTAATHPIPVQVKAGAQVALETVDDGEQDGFPMPDGLDIPFEVRNFTLRHALALACKAESEADFAAAAERYASFVDTLDRDGSGAMSYDLGFKAVHLSNLGSLYVLAGRQRDALSAYGRAELISGATSATERGMRAAIARLRNDPRADLPLPRIMFPFWYRMTMTGRILFSVCAFLAFAGLFWIAVRAGRRLSIIVAAIGVSSAAEASLFGGRNPFAGFFDDMQMMPTMREGACPIGATAGFASREVMVGEPVDLVVTLDPGSVKIDPWSIKVRPKISGNCVAGKFSSDRQNVFRLPVTFLEAATNGAELAVSGIYSGTYCITNGNMISSGRVVNQPFKIDVSAASVAVRPLPREGRPAEFSGAIGRSFRLRQVATPSMVHPGDLVTVEYRLDFDGYCPSNAMVRVDGISEMFKAYDVKEESRNPNSVVWRQMLVPRTSEATNTPCASFSYFNLKTRCYERVTAPSAALSYVSSKAAPTENTKVAIDTQSASAASSSGGIGPSHALRFAPSEKSPVVVVLPSDCKVRETALYNGWRRLESDQGSGWVRLR